MSNKTSVSQLVVQDPKVGHKAVLIRLHLFDSRTFISIKRGWEALKYLFIKGKMLSTYFAGHTIPFNHFNNLLTVLYKKVD